jgi:MoxR-like ATPase
LSLSVRDPLENLSLGNFGSEALRSWQAAGDAVHISDRVVDYVKKVVDRTRNHEALKLGVSTRGGVIWVRMARARALLCGRDYVIPDDLLVLAGPCLGHRVIARSAGSDMTLVLDGILKSIDIE